MHQPGSHMISLPSFCGACLNFLSREGFSRPFPSLTVKSNFEHPRTNRSPLVGHDVKKNHSSCDCAEIRTGFEVLTEPPERSAYRYCTYYAVDYHWGTRLNPTVFGVCVCYHPFYSGRQACGRTSRGHTGGRSHRISPPFFCGACLNISREKDSAAPSLVDRKVEFCVLDLAN